MMSQMEEAYDDLEIDGGGSRPGWHDLADCKGDPDPNDWYPPSGGGNVRAQRICGRCPARTECLAHALNAPEPDGIWGGVSSNDRRRLRRRASGARPFVANQAMIRTIFTQADRELASTIRREARRRERRVDGRRSKGKRAPGERALGEPCWVAVEPGPLPEVWSGKPPSDELLERRTLDLVKIIAINVGPDGQLQVTTRALMALAQEAGTSIGNGSLVRYVKQAAVNKGWLAVTEDTSNHFPSRWQVLPEGWIVSGLNPSSTSDN